MISWCSMILAVGGASSSLALTIKILMETVDANRRATATAVAMTCSYSAYALRSIFKLRFMIDQWFWNIVQFISLKIGSSPFIVGTIYGTFSKNETNEEKFHALQQSLLICPAVSLIGAGSFLFARFILTKWLWKKHRIFKFKFGFLYSDNECGIIHIPESWSILQCFRYSTHVRISLVACHCNFIKLVRCCYRWDWLSNIFR